MKSSMIGSLLKKEQLIALFCLAVVILISWAYTLHMAWGCRELKPK